MSRCLRWCDERGRRTRRGRKSETVTPRNACQPLQSAHPILAQAQLRRRPRANSAMQQPARAVAALGDTTEPLYLDARSRLRRLHNGAMVFACVTPKQTVRRHARRAVRSSPNCHAGSAPSVHEAKRARWSQSDACWEGPGASIIGRRGKAGEAATMFCAATPRDTVRCSPTFTAQTRGRKPL